MSLEKAKKICLTLVEQYGNTAVDLQGGEPTLFPSIFELIDYCNRIGLAPTLITNALLLDNSDICLRYRDAGVRDYLISVQGLGDVHDGLVGCPGAHRRQMTAIGNLRRVGSPFRFNVVMSKPAVPQLPDIARLAISTGALVVNFITFNPFADQSGAGHRCSDNVPRYSEVRPFLTEAIDLLEEAGIETNVRYFPFCMVEERHRKNIYNFQQLSYDPHEWDFASWGWTGLEPQRRKEGFLSPPLPLVVNRLAVRNKGRLKQVAESIPLIKPVLYRGHQLLSSLVSLFPTDRDRLYREVARVHAQLHCGYRYGEHCRACHIRLICDGFHGDYATLFGTGEAKPVLNEEKPQSPLHYIIGSQSSLVSSQPADNRLSF